MNEQWMDLALQEAQNALQLDEVPVGCVIVKDGQVLARGYNRKETEQSALSHAEINAIAAASKALGSWYLTDCDLYVTLEPCVMCCGAIVQTRIRHVYFGAYDPKGGGVTSVARLFELPGVNHHPMWTGGIKEQESAALFTGFFRSKRIRDKA
jgi:tRNA(adenine34) deaminase